MSTSALREEVVDRAYSLSPDEFEVLCKVVLGETLRTSALAVTPSSQDGGIDIEGRLAYDWFAADIGVQAKRYDPDGRAIGNDRIHRLAGALAENNYHVGTFVTTASYTRPARDAAERLPVQLVDGDDLARTMVDAGIGVRTGERGYELAEQFWATIETTTEAIPASDVPLGSNVDRIRAVLRAMRHTNGTKPRIRAWVRDQTGDDLGDRHVYLNANSATVLGFARKEPAATDASLQQWGLTETGAAYLAADPESRVARGRLSDAIRSVELVRRLLGVVEERGEVGARELDTVVGDSTTGLSDTSVRRRGSAVRSWLSHLPEIRVERSGNSKRYSYVPEADSRTTNG